MDLSEITKLLTSQTVIDNAVGGFIASLATQFVNNLFNVNRLFARHSKPETKKAIENAMTLALAETVLWLTDEQDRISHFATLFEQWLLREEVILELYQFIDPKSNVTLNVELLATEFTEAGWSTEDLDAGYSFHEIVLHLATNFATFAATEPVLQGQIYIQLLHEVVNQSRKIVRIEEAQTSVLQQIHATLAREHPLNLSALEQRYLRELYHNCNEIPLASDEQSDPGQHRLPKLQRVYVNLLTQTLPSAAQIKQRLTTAGVDPKQIEKKLFAFVKAQNLSFSVAGDANAIEKMRMVGPQTQAKLRRLDENYWVHSLRSLFAERRQELAEALEVESEELTRVLAPISPLDALKEHHQIVILGDPGSGKSTLTQRLAALLAAASCGDPQIYAEVAETEAEALSMLLTQIEANWLPVRIVLSRWATHLSEPETGCADDLIQECLRLLGRVGHVASFQEHFEARIKSDSPSILLLLDGLDEVTDDAKRSTILKAIHHFHQSHDTVPLIVTCRIRPYQAWQKKGQDLNLPPFTLAPLNQVAIEEFIERWYAELARVGIYEVAGHEAAQTRLITALRDPRRKELREMAGTPLLLTMMAHVNRRRGLPDSRAELYERFVQKLLYEWERLKQDDQGESTHLELLLRQAGWDKNKLDSALNELAWRIHSQAQNNDTVDIQQHEIERILRRNYLGDDDANKAKWAVDVLNLIADRYGLINLVDRDSDGAGIYKFSHRTFQEYLAARRLTMGSSSTILTQFEAVIEQEQWREAVLLAFGHMAHVLPRIEDLLVLFGKWLTTSPQTDGEWSRLLLIGEAYIYLVGQTAISQCPMEFLQKQVHKAFIEQLTAAMQHPTLPPRQRLDAGLLLAELETGPADVDDLVKINAGPKLGIEFKIGKYPVTNTQFRRFFDDDGYRDERWWSEAGVKAKAEYEYREPRFWDDTRCNRNSQPVVGISWYEAEAYCTWLTVQWRANGKIKQEEKVRLPTQAEWEAAARNKHGKEYPWGSDAFDAARANTEESNLDQTSPVHMYPDGISADGVWDLSGNVFEWTKDLVKDDQERAWLKGGCAWANKDYAKASAADGWSGRWFWYFSGGCRVVVVPISR